MQDQVLTDLESVCAHRCSNVLGRPACGRSRRQPGETKCHGVALHHRQLTAVMERFAQLPSAALHDRQKSGRAYGQQVCRMHGLAARNFRQESPPTASCPGIASAQVPFTTLQRLQQFQFLARRLVGQLQRLERTISASRSLPGAGSDGLWGVAVSGAMTAMSCSLQPVLATLVMSGDIASMVAGP
jgi:hypothetical protein